MDDDAGSGTRLARRDGRRGRWRRRPRPRPAGPRAPRPARPRRWSRRARSPRSPTRRARATTCPPGVLRLSRSELLATSSGQRLELSVTLDRDVAAGTLEVTLPARWAARSGVSDLPFARLPAAGRGSSARAAARRSGRVVELAFDGARSGRRRELRADRRAASRRARTSCRTRGASPARRARAAAREVVLLRADARGARVRRDWLRLANPGVERNVDERRRAPSPRRS